MGKIIISKLFDQNFLFLFNDNHEIEYIKCIRETMVDKIYIGKICDINQGLKCCFVSISPEQKVFLSLSEFKDNPPKCGDSVVVQIKTDPIKTKLAQGSLNICLPGQYCVCHLEGIGLSVSKKISMEDRSSLMLKLSDFDIPLMNDYKWVLRTNASVLLENNNFEALEQEIQKFIDYGQKIRNQSDYLSIYSLLYSPVSEVLSIIGNISSEEYDSVVTDNKEYYDAIKQSELFNNKEIKYYDDEYISLKNLHSLETYLLRAIDKKVYLDCGGYLVIEPTEAMTVIDVNSGKAEGKKKDNASYIYKVNKEAAFEIAKQLKIRNISGMIMVDFINMQKEEDINSLLNVFRKELSKDKTKTVLVDITPLGIVEITRKKIDISLDKSFWQ